MKNKWLKDYPMIDYKKADCKKIKNSVGEKLTEQKGEVIYMKHKRLKPIAIIGAILAVSTASIFTVNAATDGAVVDTVKEWFTNVTVYINGEEVELPAKIREVNEDDYGYKEIEVEIDDGQLDDEHHEMIFEIDEDFNLKVVEDTEESSDSQN